MSVEIKSALSIPRGFEGMEADILKELNDILNILCNPDMNYKYAETYFSTHHYTYFAILCLNDKCWIRQYNPEEKYSKTFIVKNFN